MESKRDREETFHEANRVDVLCCSRGALCSGMRGADPAFARDIEGWVYPDMHSDGNAVLQRVRQQIPSGGPSGPWQPPVACSDLKAGSARASR